MILHTPALAISMMLFSVASGGTRSQPPEQHLAGISCRDQHGTPVDWWILLKTAGASSEYTIYTSIDAQAGRTSGSQLNPSIRLDNFKDSAFLRTVYESMAGAGEGPTDSRVFLAWNDQQPREDNSNFDSDDGEESPLKEKAHSSKKIVNKDMYDQGESVASAHSKGMIGMGVVDSAGRICGSYNSNQSYRVEGFFINHSFPRTPNARSDPLSPGGEVYRRKLPPQADFFGSNIRTPQAKGQHAVCLSFTQDVSVSPVGEIQYQRARVDRENMNLFALLDGLDTIAPSMLMTTFIPWNLHHRIWHQIFDVRSHFRPDPITFSEVIKNDNIPRVNSRTTPYPSYSSHAFPLWTAMHSVKFNDRFKPKYSKRTTSSSLRAPLQMNLSRCPKWSKEASPSANAGCFTSIVLRTTARQHQISPAIDFKSGMMIADVDDIIGARLVPLQDIQEASSHRSVDGRPRYVAIMVVVQSWIDYLSFGPSSRFLVNTPALKVKAWFHNNYFTHLPCSRQGLRAQQSYGNDHSKWFIASYLYGQKGNFVPLAGFMDLNRNSKATKLPNRAHGRGGMFIFFNDPLIVSFMMMLHPLVPEDSARTNLDTSIFHAHHIRQDVSMGTIVGFDKTSNAMQVKYAAYPNHQHIFHVPYTNLPREVESSLLPSRKPSNNIPFLIGSTDPEDCSDTPPRIKSAPVLRSGSDFTSSGPLSSYSSSFSDNSVQFEEINTRFGFFNIKDAPHEKQKYKLPPLLPNNFASIPKSFMIPNIQGPSLNSGHDSSRASSSPSNHQLDCPASSNQLTSNDHNRVPSLSTGKPLTTKLNSNQIRLGDKFGAPASNLPK